jgi:putative phosphoribosyl transferase
MGVHHGPTGGLVTSSYGSGTFADRADAGRQLAAGLTPVLAGETARADRPLLLGLPRGGVVVAAAAAAELGLPFDAIAVRKVGAPTNPELALGAVTADGTVLLNEQVVRAEELTGPEVADLVAAAQAQAQADDRRYRGARPPVQVGGDTVVVVDDGAATGATVRAAVAALRAAGARRVVVALPVAPRETVAVLEREADTVVCLRRPLLFRAVGWAYADFAPTPTERVVELLRAAG